MKVIIIGIGLIGCERIKALKLISKEIDSNIELISIFDIDKKKLSEVGKKYDIPISTDIEEIINLKPDWVFIATSNDAVKDIVLKAFDKNTNVLIEKPFGRSLKECNNMISVKPDDKMFNIGFNYRFFAGVEKALYDVKSGKFGDLISVNLILGHGNAPGVEKSWRFKPENHGDCITDLGVHLMDLILQLSKGVVNIDYVKSWKGFWNTGIEEETHFIASDENNTIFNAQVSLNRWRSTFRLEINGTEGYGIVENRGRSYGPQSYRTGKRWGWLSGQKQSDSEVLEIDSNDCSDSFIKETISVLGLTNNCFESTSTACTHKEGKKVMELLEQCLNKLDK